MQSREFVNVEMGEIPRRQRRVDHRVICDSGRSFGRATPSYNTLSRQLRGKGCGLADGPPLTAISACGFNEVVRAGELIAKRWPVVLGILLVAAAGGLLWAPWDAPEPVYNGKPLGFWFGRQANRFALIGGRFDVSAFEGLSQKPGPPELIANPDAVPSLVKALRRRDNWFGAAVYRKQVWPKLPAVLQKYLPMPNDKPQVRAEAAYILWQMGPVAKPAVPALRLRLKEDSDWVVRFYAALAIGTAAGGDGSAFGALVKGFGDKTFAVRFAATNSLLSLDPGAALDAGVPIPNLLRSARYILWVRQAMTNALVRGDGRIIAAYAVALNDRDAAVHTDAAFALQESDAEGAAKPLVGWTAIDLYQYLRRAGAPSSRAYVAKALGNLRNLRKDRLVLDLELVDEELRMLLTDPDDFVRAEATNSVLKFVEAAAQAEVEPPSP